MTGATDDAVMKQLRWLAHGEGKPLSEVVNAMLVDGLQNRKEVARQDFELQAHSMGRPEVNLGDRSALEVVNPISVRNSQI